jgi:pheromone shutdown protein TraB
MHNEQILMEKNEKYCSTKCISWTSIVVGALIALGLTFLLNLFSTAIGLSAYKLSGGSSLFAIGGFLGFAIGIVATMFAAGWLAGYLGRSYCYNKNLGSMKNILCKRPTH